jgi:hypothetical protein
MLLRTTGLATFAEVEPTNWATFGANMRAAIVYDGIDGRREAMIGTSKEGLELKLRGLDLRISRSKGVGMKENSVCGQTAIGCQAVARLWE